MIPIPSTYTTITDDRWDWIAKKTLGSELYADKLIAANPAHAHYYALPEGVTLAVPEIAKQPTAQLPPWRTEAAT